VCATIHAGSRTGLRCGFISGSVPMLPHLMTAHLVQLSVFETFIR
jgi:hypothetical protein